MNMIEEKTIYDSIIVGSGPAGLTAAIYHLRAEIKTLVIAGNQPGGQLTITTTVDNFPGFPDGIGGVKLMMDMQAQVKNLGGEIRQGVVKKVYQVESSSSYKVELEDKTILQSRTVIVATGAGAKWLGLPKEKELIGKGISGCATCDGMFFKDKIVVVVGGGDTACEDAVFLAKFATKVYMIHRRDSLRATAAEQEEVFKNKKIEMIWNSEIMEINPNPSKSPFDERETLKTIKIKNNVTNEEKILEVDGLFVAIGRIPATDSVKDLVKLKESGHILIGLDQKFITMTSVGGIFAAGDCADDVYRQAVVAAGDGCRAALDAQKWMKSVESLSSL